MYLCLGILAVSVIPVTTVAGVANDFNGHVTFFGRSRGSPRVEGHFFNLADCLVCSCVLSSIEVL